MLNFTAGPTFVAEVLLVLASLTKIVRPGNTSRALMELKQVWSCQRDGLDLSKINMAIRFGALLEGAIGLGALVYGSPVVVLLSGVSYLVFGAFVGLAYKQVSVVSTCGCFGEIDSPPTISHLILNIVLGGFCLAYALSGGSYGIGRILTGQPYYALPFVVVMVVGVYAAYLLIAVLPKLVQLRGDR